MTRPFCVHVANCGLDIQSDAICCDLCDIWFHLGCNNFDVRNNASHSDRAWDCGCQGASPSRANVFARHVSDIIRSVKRSEIGKLLRFVKCLHSNLSFTMEMENENGCFPLPDMLISRRDRKMETRWYSKPHYVFPFMRS